MHIYLDLLQISSADFMWITLWISSADFHVDYIMDFIGAFYGFHVKSI